MKDNVHSNWRKYDKSISLTNFLQNYSNINVVCFRSWYDSRICPPWFHMVSFSLDCVLLAEGKRPGLQALYACTGNWSCCRGVGQASNVKRIYNQKFIIGKYTIGITSPEVQLAAVVLGWLIIDLPLHARWKTDALSVLKQMQASPGDARCQLDRELNTRWNIGEIESVGARWWDCWEEQWRNMQVCHDVKHGGLVVLIRS